MSTLWVNIYAIIGESALGRMSEGPNVWQQEIAGAKSLVQGSLGQEVLGQFSLPGFNWTQVNSEPHASPAWIHGV